MKVDFDHLKEQYGMLDADEKLEVSKIFLCDDVEEFDDMILDAVSF